jgi:hypothetical protein
MVYELKCANLYSLLRICEGKELIRFPENQESEETNPVLKFFTTAVSKMRRQVRKVAMHKVAIKWHYTCVRNIPLSIGLKRP